MASGLKSKLLWKEKHSLQMMFDWKFCWCAVYNAIVDFNIQNSPKTFLTISTITIYPPACPSIKSKCSILIDQKMDHWLCRFSRIQCHKAATHVIIIIRRDLHPFYLKTSLNLFPNDAWLLNRGWRSGRDEQQPTNEKKKIVGEGKWYRKI